MKKSYPRMVYAIRHRRTKRIYIGSSDDVSRRVIDHMVLLNSNQHSVELMQSDFNKYRIDYVVYVLDRINSEEEDYKEYWWMERLKTRDSKYGYNYKDRNHKYKFDDIPNDESSRIERLGVVVYRIADCKQVEKRKRSWMPFLSISNGWFK